MTVDWCPGIREACMHWRDAPMLQQTFEALERTLEEENDTCIDCAKAVVEAMCRAIVENFHTQQTPLRPAEKMPKLSVWLSAAVRALKLGDERDNRFRKLVSCHNDLATALNDLRNEAGPVCHGRDPYLERLSVHHRRTAVLAADTMVAFLHKAYLETQLNPISSREPWERFAEDNALIDKHIRLFVDNEDVEIPTLHFLLPDGNELPLDFEVSRILYQLDREAYVEALNVARGIPIPPTEQFEEQGE